MQRTAANRWLTLLAACALAYLVGVVFSPMVIAGYEFVESEVVLTVVQNPYIRGLTGDNLEYIFTSRCITSYYPIRTLSYAVDHQVWGLNPSGFKLTNGLIHLANVLLVFWLIRRFVCSCASPDRSSNAWWDVSAAAFPAGIFAVHPVVVEPVVWVAGREELMMTLGALGCLHFHWTARRLGRDGRGILWIVACHIAAAFCCAVACLSNAVGAVIPLLIVALDVLTLTRPRLWKIVYGTAPLWAIGILTIAFKGPGRDPALSGQIGLFSAKRLMLVLDVYWQNLEALVWPRDLALFYGPLAPESFLERGVIFGGIAFVLTCVFLWKLRRAKLALFGVLWFGLALGPTLQIIPHHIYRADRFLYLPLVGLAIALGVGLRPLGNALKSRLAAAGMIVMGVLCLFVLDTLSAHQVQTWRNSVLVWENCVRATPNHFVPHRVLADSLAKRGRLDRAIPHYETALELAPDYIDAIRNYASSLATCEDEQLRDDVLAIKLAERGCKLTDWRDPGLRRVLAMACTRHAAALKQAGQFRMAVQYYRTAVDADPFYDAALPDLVYILATSNDDELRDREAAIRLAERACRLSEYRNPVNTGVLAAAYAEAGRFEEAVATAERAIQAAQAAGDKGLTKRLQHQLEGYRNRKPADKQPD